MPYEVLPERLRAIIPSEDGQEMFRQVVNSQLAAGKTEAVAMASAWAALQRAGYDKNEEGLWVEKSSRTMLENKMREYNEKYGDKHGRVTMAMLQRVYDRGVGAYRTNPESVRPNVTSPEQWAAARVNSFLDAARGAKAINHDKDVHDEIDKTMPTMSQVHVPGAEWDYDDKSKTNKASGAEPIYMYRPVMNAEQIHEWAASQGFTSALPLDDLHVTVVFSKAAFSADLSRVAEVNGTVHYHNIVVRGGKRAVVPLGDEGAVVLKIQSDELQYEHLMFRQMGASWDFQEYTPHISITYQGRDLPIADMQPFVGDIVLGPLRAKPMNTDWDSEIVEVPLDVQKAETYQPPAAAKNSAQRVLDWKEKYGDEVKGMTPVGWARARQLASGKPVSRDTVARMAAFNRHRQNAELAPEYKDTPWKDRGYVAWLGWGNTTGVDWARSIMQRLNKRMMNDDSFTTSAEAAVRSMELGLNGEVHVHETADGQAVYMPGASHEAYIARMGELGNAAYESDDEYEDEDETGEDAEMDAAEPRQDLLERAISAMVSAIMTYDVNKTSKILKLDSERRIAWGWASVSTMKGELVTDLQGDIITTAEMEKMADRFMMSARTAKAMHEGDSIGEVIHSFPLTNELAKAFGMDTDREGWIIGMKIYDAEVWDSFKRGELAGFSIGGKAKRTPK